MFEDEASFWQDGSLHQTWAPVGQQPQVDTFGNRNTAHVYGAIEVAEAPKFHYQFAEKFNGATYLVFLKALVEAYDLGRPVPTKLFLITDNGPCHNLDAEGKAWLAENHDRIALHRLPPYSPQYNGIEGCWKVTRKMTTHNAFHATREARDAALIRTFQRFQAEPALVAGHVRRFHG